MTSFTSLLSFIVFMASSWIIQGLPERLAIGGLFEAEFEGQRMAFTYAIEKINLRNDILPKTLLIYDVQEVQMQDSFHASKKACKQLKDGVGALFGPMSSLPSAHVQSMCNAMEVPHLMTRSTSQENTDFYSINLFPHYVQLSKAYLELIQHLGWTEFTLLYEDGDGLMRLEEILNVAQNNKIKITVRKLKAVQGKYITLLKDMKAKREYRIIVDSSLNTAKELLKQAQEVSVLTDYYHYIFTTLDLGALYLDRFIHNGANITGLRLIDPLKPLVASIRNEWAIEAARNGKSPLMGLREIQTEPALIYDAVTLYSKALNELSLSQDINPIPLSCSRTQTWNHGNNLMNYMKLMDFEGLSGRVRYDENGMRTSFELDIVELTLNGLMKTGTWKPGSGINITKEYAKIRKQEFAKSLTKKTLLVTTVIDAPYTMESSPGVYEGFGIDLLDKIAQILKFKYKIRVVADGKFGAPDENGEWNGMVRELMERKADLAVAGMSITYKREKVIDFTKPFLNLGISILYRKPEKTSPKLFSFLSPLSIEVWVYVNAAYLCVSFIMFLLARLSPYEWYSTRTCGSYPGEVENQFTIMNSLWFTIGSLMQQGSDVAPRATSTRLVGGVWWFFTLIFISSYTANLAAFLTVERMISPIEGADDLAKQTEIKYGSLHGGSTMTFFQSSEIPTFKRMWTFMNTTKPTVFVQNNNEGIKRVMNEKYAFLAESTAIDYHVQRNCDLMQVGGNLDSKGYGIATPRGSRYRDLISDTILKLQEDQVIQRLYTTWWMERNGGGACGTEDSKKVTTELGMGNLGGVFVVLMIGVGAGIIVALLEFLWKARENAKNDKQSIWSEIKQELRFALSCSGKSRKMLTRSESNENVLENDLHLMPLSGKPLKLDINGKESYA